MVPIVETKTPDEPTLAEQREVSWSALEGKLPRDLLRQSREAPENAPQAFGQWATASCFSNTRNNWMPVCWRLTEIRQASADDLAAYRAKGGGEMPPQVDPHLAWYLLSYQVWYPFSYPTGEETTGLALQVVNETGGAFTKDGVQYLGLNGVWNMPEPQTIQPGQSLEFEALYVMLADEPPYAFRYIHGIGVGSYHESYLSNR